MTYVEESYTLSRMSHILGMKRFLELNMLIAISYDSDSREDLEIYLTDEQIASILSQGVGLDELHYDLCVFTDDRGLFVLNRVVGTKAQESFDEFGYSVLKWVSDTSAIVASNETEKIPELSRRAIRYTHSFQGMGRYH